MIWFRVSHANQMTLAGDPGYSCDALSVLPQGRDSRDPPGPGFPASEGAAPVQSWKSSVVPISSHPFASCLNCKRGHGKATGNLVQDAWNAGSPRQHFKLFRRPRPSPAALQPESLGHNVDLARLLARRSGLADGHFLEMGPQLLQVLVRPRTLEHLGDEVRT